MRVFLYAFVEFGISKALSNLRDDNDIVGVSVVDKVVARAASYK